MCCAQELCRFDLGDVFRMLHGYGTDADADADAYSWVQRKKGKLIRRRFDHVFASRKLNAKSCQRVRIFLGRSERGYARERLLQTMFGTLPRTLRRAKLVGK
jgi:hypothetical protein